MSNIWKNTGWFVEPTDAREVISAIGAIGVHSKIQQFAWRGLSSSSFPLTSHLHRYIDGPETEMRREEEALLESAREWGIGVHPTGYSDDLQLLAELQHYGIATRLIDVTSNPLTALWFACQDGGPGGNRDGVLLALNITDWQRYNSTGAFDPTWEDVGSEYSGRLREALRSERPFVVRADVPNDRIRAQEGYFVASSTPQPMSNVSDARIHTDPFRSLQVPFNRGPQDRLSQILLESTDATHDMQMPFVAVIIKHTLKRRILRSLEGSFNRTARVLFPDVGGFLEYGDHARARQRAH